MKKLSLLIIILLIIQTIAFSQFEQSCLPDGFTFTTQAQVDSFKVQYPICSKILGDITISGHDISDLSGFINITSIQGNLEIGSNNGPNNGLLNLLGLNNLNTVSGNFIIHQNFNLKSLTGLESLESIHKSLRIYGNDSLRNIENLNAINSPILDLTISHNKSLVDISGLENISYIKGDLTISNCPVLLNLTGLDKIDSIGGDLRIIETGLTEISGFQKLKKINSGLYLDKNYDLNSIAAFSKIKRLRYLEMDYNTSLSDLNGLDSLTTITQHGLHITNNSSLTDVYALRNLESSGGDLIIKNNNKLTSLNYLINLKSTGEHIYIENNDALVDLSGLENIKTEDVNIRITENENLKSISTLNTIDTVRSISIEGNPRLKTLSGLENLKLAEWGVVISNNDSLKNLDELQNLQTSIGIGVVGNEMLTDISGLSNLDSVFEGYYGGVLIVDNPNLLSLNGLENIKKVKYLTIKRNGLLKNLSGLENLTRINGILTIEENVSLKTLKELRKVNMVGDYIRITKNDSLNSLDGLENMNLESMFQLYIFQNPLLSNCEVQSICSYLINQDGYLIIKNNASGCNSEDEILNACLVAVENQPLQYNLSIYPNPFTTTTTIAYELHQPQTVQISIFNHLGQQVHYIREEQSTGKQQMIWNADGLPSGMYYFTIRMGKKTARGKLVVAR